MEPKLNIFVLCTLQDGTGKALLKISGQVCIKAFQIKDEMLNKLTAYCQKYGEFRSGVKCKEENDEILNAFTTRCSFQPVVFYCKPYCNINRSDKTYTQTIEMPSYMLRDPYQKIFLNGESNATCLKVLAVENKPWMEAIRNAYSM